MTGPAHESPDVAADHGEGDGDSGVFAALSYPRYRRIWAAQFVAMVGFWMLVTARAVLVFDITGSAGALGLIYFFTFIPQLVLAPLSGVMADRYDRRHLLMATQAVAAIGALALGLLAASGNASLANVAAISFLLGCMQTLMGPAGNALMPSLVDRAALSSAVTLHSAMMQASRIVGPLLAAAMIPVFGLEWLFYVNAASGLVILAAWWITPVRTAVGAATESAFKAFKRGFDAVRRAPDLWAPIVIVAVINGIGLVYQPLGVAYVTDALAGGDETRGAFLYGLMQAMLGVGAVIGVVGIGGIATRWPANSLLFCSIGFSISLIALGATGVVGLALLAAVVLGAFHFAQLTIAMNLVQHQVREDLRGRVMSIYMLAFVGILPISSFIAGGIAEAIGVSATFVGAGILCLIFSLFALRWRDLIHMDGPDASAARIARH